MHNDDVILLIQDLLSAFTEGFIPGSIFIGLDGRYAEWAGSFYLLIKRF